MYVKFWNHIQGFPFFQPAFVPHNQLTLYSPFGDLPERLVLQQQFAFFPVPVSCMSAELNFEKVRDNRWHRIGNVRLYPMLNTWLKRDPKPRSSSSVAGPNPTTCGRVTWDLTDFGRRLAREGRWQEAIAELEKGRALYRGDFLAEDRFADWAADIRREIAGDFRDLLIHLADSYAALDRYAGAIEACETALNKDPLMESVYRRLMRFHYYKGEKGRALKVYRDCLKLFEELFGESPTPVTRQLHDAIANDEPLDCLPDGD